MSNGNFAETHNLCLPKDLSILNRRGYASTTRKGVPLVYRVAATVYPTGLDGSGYTTSVSSDVRTTVKFLGCQNNWVMKNAAVKWHAAREAMFKKAGVPKKHRGAYAYEIRYSYDGSASGDFADPVDANGDAFTGGTWDLSEIVTLDDASFSLKLVGDAASEESGVAITHQQIGYSYLASRANLRGDTNDEVEQIAQTSILQDLLSPTQLDPNFRDNVNSNVEDEQDDVPYDLFTSTDTANDITEEVELGRSVLMPQGSGATLPQTTILDVPFGLMRVLMAHRDPGDNSGITDDLALGLEVLDIFEMQG